jgi:hypothetical protein
MIKIIPRPIPNAVVSNGFNTIIVTYFINHMLIRSGQTHIIKVSNSTKYRRILRLRGSAWRSHNPIITTNMEKITKYTFQETVLKKHFS